MVCGFRSDGSSLLQGRLQGLLLSGITSVSRIVLVEGLAGVGLRLDIIVLGLVVGRHGGGGAQERISRGVGGCFGESAVAINKTDRCGISHSFGEYFPLSRRQNFVVTIGQNRRYVRFLVPVGKIRRGLFIEEQIMTLTLVLIWHDKPDKDICPSLWMNFGAIHIALRLVGALTALVPVPYLQVHRVLRTTVITYGLTNR